jgi:hypothetical protein
MSGRRINYNLRPAKHVERKMLVESFRRLNEFGSIESYRYIGFGSFYFRDFQLLHKNLGIENMISIEREVGNRPRFEFNKPFNCISMQYNESNAVLPTLDWDIRTILWLDYDGKLTTNVLTDIQFFCSNAFPGSVIIVTVNVAADPYDENAENSALERFQSAVGIDNVPLDIKDKDLKKDSLAIVCRRIVNNQILDTLHKRNGARAANNRFEYKQLFNFHYSDSADMLTVGGLVYDAGQSHNVAKCGFESLHFIRTSLEYSRSDNLGQLQDDAYQIEIPNLTYKELRYLDSQLPQGIKLLRSVIPETEVRQYAKIYRYFPTFTEAEI